ncbi:3-keto-disaccharide hydrolase [Stieleria varia]|uniref:3-keto-alpha-glucoside-1,2-lyase/3-keto-2-hydroxy-glucal hydratase domain-containing protein n=1 Tax=Stieleria varia TaxID=2528005 RepID=A0A5C6B3G7_9BACT|nr:DUF1080 domain-containing protein [Stieleria varia]TWU06297.1 hypothetical protein Pla52n_20180 [Stieleria varia]
MKLNLFLSTLFFALTPFTSFADQAGKAFTDAASAGPAFALQGEYRGTVTTEEGEKKFGAQVIALGGDEFTVVGFHGGLPGDGWKRGDKQMTIPAKLVDGKIQGMTDGGEFEIADGKITVTVDGETIGRFEKVERKSPTLGAKPPADAVVLFDGSSADAFENGSVIEGDLLGATNCFTKDKFGDHHLHIEFRTPFMPDARGQGRGNSGVYIQGRYEMQVLDSFGLEGKNNECGGIYSISEPIVNMCFPPLSWQTYDMDFTAARYDADGKKIKNARATIKHNGVVIHDDLELTHGTPGYHAEGPGPDSLFLQNHGNPVAFRNIWVVKK